MNRIASAILLICLGMGFMPQPHDEPLHVIYLPLVTGGGPAFSNFHVSDTCEGPPRTQFPSRTDIWASFDYRNLGTVTYINLYADGEQTGWRVFYDWFPDEPAPWGAGTCCLLVLEPAPWPPDIAAPIGVFTVTCYLGQLEYDGRWFVGQQFFEIIE
jgi:hypothetical protein